MKTKDISRKMLSVVEDALYELDRLREIEREKSCSEDYRHLDAVMLAQFELEYMEKLNEFKHSLGYISKDFEVEGALELNSNGRYVLGHHELTCASSIEIFDVEENRWMAGRIESSESMGGYYFYGRGNGFENRCIFEGTLAKKRV